MTIFYSVLFLAVFAGFEILLLYMGKMKVSFTVRIMTALVLGLFYGVFLQVEFGAQDPVTTLTNQWFGIVGSGFTKALQFLIVPVVLVSIMNAITRAGTGERAVRSSVKILSILLGTTGIAALIGYGTALAFRLDAGDLISGVTQADRAPTDIPTSILNFIPSNLFEALSGNRAIPVVMIAVLIGISILTIRKNNPDLGEKFIHGVAGANELVMTITDYIIGFTPYGVLALIAKIASTKDFQSVLTLLLFVVALYVAIVIMFLVHLAILAALKVNPVQYLRKVLPTLLFAFTSRSSAATLPMTIKTQIDLLGVDSTSANLSSAFGTTIGQNGCAGIYPAVVATVVAKVLGWNITSIGFLLLLVFYIIITSFGIGGVGGGATNATILLLALFGLPIDLVAILISVDFIVDMARTALNVNDSILAGIVSSKMDHLYNESVFDSVRPASETSAE
ncbi:MAG: Cation:dicarboxylase symporter family transporter [Oscillospiraceae bacterium]|jgi:uncharacterized protein